MEHTLRISCADCSQHDTSVCADCLVTFVLTREPDDAVVLNFEEQRALRRLSASGLLPEVRHQHA